MAQHGAGEREALGEAPPDGAATGSKLFHIARGDPKSSTGSIVSRILQPGISQKPLPAVPLRPKILFACFAASAFAAAVPRTGLAQNITIDGRLSAAKTLAGPNYDIAASLGKQVGGNLFHSFGQFGLINGETAAFSGPATINNVIGRVTGGSRSDIDGKIQSNITGANLFLINPSGIVFGQNAKVDVKGSFHASTADYLKMSDGAKFQATNPDGSTLSAAPPAAFGFLTASPPAISVNGSALGPVAGTLGLVGGPVSIRGGATLSAPAGTIHVTSAAGTGEVPVDPRNTSALTVSKFDHVDIKGGSKLDVSDAKNLASGGSVYIRSGALTIDASEINVDNYGSGAGGQLVLQADSKITLSNKANAHALAQASGGGADIILRSSPDGAISVDNSTVAVGSRTLASGNGGQLSVATGKLTLAQGAALKSDTQGSGNGGPIKITADAVLLDGGAALDQSTGIFSTTSGSGSGGLITIVAGELTLHNGAGVLAQSLGTGAGGTVDVRVGGPLIVDSGASLGTTASGDGNAGEVAVMVSGPINIDMSVGADKSILNGIGSLTQGAGNAGNVAVSAGDLTITNNGAILDATTAAGNSGDVSVNVSGSVTVNRGASLGTLALDPATGNAGNVSVITSGAVTVDMSVGADSSLLSGIAASVTSTAEGAGNPGNVTVRAGELSILNRGIISSTPSPQSTGRAGDVTVNVAGGLSIDGTMTPDFFTGISADTTGKGDAGNVTVTAGSLSIINTGLITSTTGAGSTVTQAETIRFGNGGNVSVNVDGGLTIDGTMTPRRFTGITAETEASGDAGIVTVMAGNAKIVSEGNITSSTTFSGAAGNVSVNVAGTLVIDGAGRPTGITTEAVRGSSGHAGSVFVGAGTLILVGGGDISSNARGADRLNPGATGNAGNVTVSVDGFLSIDGSGSTRTRPTAIATNTEPGTIGDAGSVRVNAQRISIMRGAQISSTTAGTGAGGSVDVTTGALVLDGAGIANTQIAASATGSQSGPGGQVTVKANTLTVEGGAQIASTTAGPREGGPITVIVASDIVLPDRGPQITAQSTGSGDAGSITVSAARLLMNNKAAISTEAETSMASGGNITLQVSDLVYLVNSGISTSVKGETGSGGNIRIDPQLVILNHSRIVAEAIEGHGGNIKINAGAFIASADSEVNASSQKGISGTVEITGPRVDVNGALVVLSSELRGRAAVLREACAAYGDRPISSLVEAGRGGLPQDPEATLPALYIADRDFNPNPEPGIGKTEASSAPLQTTVRLTMRCG
jgi:filamentous hemagglutinin family protein